jgi:hypothetical protein
MNQEYRFDRYRNGRKMAEGLVLTKPKTVDEAVAVASRLAEAGDVFVLREDLARLATVEAERDAARKRAEPFDRCVAAFAKTWKVGLGWDSDEKTAFLKTREQLDNAIREAAKAQLDGEHNV